MFLGRELLRDPDAPYPLPWERVSRIVEGVAWDHIAVPRSLIALRPPRAIVFDSSSVPAADDIAFQLWPGCKVTVIADRVLAGRDNNGIRGLAAYQQYVDEIEIALFMSETRRGEIVASFLVVEPFWLRIDNYSSRVRGWPSTSTGYKQLRILKNGVDVGFAYKADFSSGIKMTFDTLFETGDVLQIKAPDGEMSPGIRQGVHVTLIGELV